MNQVCTEVRTERHELYVGFRKENSIEAKLLVGTAFKDEDLNYYKIKLMMFPGQTYYLVKNRDSADRFTVFARAIHDDIGNVKFLNPIGNAVLDSRLQSYLEVKLPMLRTSIFMSLYPQRSV